MKLLQELLFDKVWLLQDSNLLEANFANSGKTEIILNVKKNDKDVEIVFNSFDKIYDRFIKTLNVRSSNVKEWFNSNFKNWVKNEMEGYEQHENFPSFESIKNKLFPDLDALIDTILEDHPQVKKSDILDKLPDFIKKNPHKASIFGSGRLFAFKYVKLKLEYLIDYLEAINHNKTNRDYMLMPDIFFSNDIKKLTPIEAIKKSIEYHVYLERIQEKVTLEELKKMFADLKPNKDYKILQKNDDGTMMVQGLSAEYVIAEGAAMKHCVGTYAQDVVSKKVIIYSFWNKEDHLPEATFEIKQNKITQLKGKHNGEVKQKYWDTIINFILDKDLDLTNDFKNIGLNSSKFQELKSKHKKIEK